MAALNRIPLFIYHLLFWTGVAAVWLYLRYQDYTTVAQAAAVTAIKVIDLAAVVYIANLLLVPQLLYRKRYLHFAVAFVALVAAASFLKGMAVKEVLGQPFFDDSIKQTVYNNFVTQFFLVLASIALRSAFDYIRLQKRLAEVAKEKAEAELAFLKAQVNPHFLFNSLNAVYFLINKENAEARHALHRFSELLRYQLYECNGHRIAIEKEIAFLEGYVSLQRLRMNEDSAISFHYGDDVHGFAIEPLLLIPFVENAFKHLSQFADGRRNKVEMRLSRQDGSLLFFVRNTTEAKAATAGGGIGLANVQRRLQLLYPGAHDLTIERRADWFSAQLNLSLK